MAYRGVEADIQRAADLRKQAQRLRDPEAKRSVNEAAARLERRAARKANKVGRRARPKPKLVV